MCYQYSMPELPEVQTTVVGIEQKTRGQKIVLVWTDWPKLFRDISFPLFRRAVVGQKIIGATRRGKYVLIHLSNKTTVIAHMKMTGHFMYGHYKKIGTSWRATRGSVKTDPWNRFVHVVFLFSGGKSLAFSDVRKFGKFVLAKTEVLSHTPPLSHLGPEPLQKDFTFELFRNRLMRRPRSKIKPVLMDQTIIAGIGNIYSDEALWRAGINPETKPYDISYSSLKKLYSAIQFVLKKGIRFGGDSTSDYRNIDGRPGKFHLRHEAYQRTGEKCRKRRCGGILMRKMVAGRSSHFCSVHQKK